MPAPQLDTKLLHLYCWWPRMCCNPRYGEQSHSIGQVGLLIPTRASCCESACSVPQDLLQSSGQSHHNSTLVPLKPVVSWYCAQTSSRRGASRYTRALHSSALVPRRGLGVFQLSTVLSVLVATCSGSFTNHPSAPRCSAGAPGSSLEHALAPGSSSSSRHTTANL